MMQAVDAALYSRIGDPAQSVEEPGLVKTPAPILPRIGEHKHEIAACSQPLRNRLTPGNAFFYIFRDKIIDVLGIPVKQFDHAFCYKLVLDFVAEKNSVFCTRVCQRGSAHLFLPSS